MKTGINAVVAIITALSPLLTYAFDLKLISDYYQPQLNAGAGLFAAIAYMSLYAFIHKSAKYKKKWFLAASLASTVVSFVLCLAFTRTIGVVWGPDWRVITVMIQIIWCLLYVFMFAAIACSICAGGMLIPETETNGKPPPTK